MKIKDILTNKSILETFLCAIILLLSCVASIPAGQIKADDSSPVYNPFIPSPLSNEKGGKGSTIYVGGSGPGNESTIQEGIDNASDGDIVFVYDGIYHEHILIEKELMVIGESKERTIVNGDNNGITVTISNGMVSFSSFTVQNGSYYGIFIDNDHGATVNDVIVKDNDIAGIYGACAVNCSIYNNTVYGNTNGIYLNFNSQSCTIYNNMISNHSARGIYLQSSHYNTIDQCSLNDNKRGIALHYCYFINIINSSISHHTEYGIGLKESYNNEICMNTFDHNDEGIRLYQKSYNNKIKYNDFFTVDSIAPIAIDDSITTQMQTAVVIDVVNNDYDRDGMVDPSTITISSFPSHGSIGTIANGTIQYEPSMGYNGTDMFSYQIQDQDGAWSNTAEVDISIVSDNLGDEIKQEQDVVNRSLSIYNNWQMAQSFRMQSGTLTQIALFLKRTGNPQSSIHLEVHKNDVDGEIVFSASRSVLDIPYVSDWIVFDDDDYVVEPSTLYVMKVFTSIGNAGNCYQWGQSTIDVYNGGRALASDDAGVSWNTMNESDFCFQIYKTIGIPPITANDKYYTAINTPLALSDQSVVDNDYDYDQGPLMLSVNLSSTVSHGELMINANGSFSYVPESGFTGTDSFYYNVTDGEYNISDTMVTIHVVDSVATAIRLPDSITASTDNHIFHNNFYSAAWSAFAFDFFTNYWDNTSIDSFGGNYWSNYNEIGEGIIDVNADTINDRPYHIAGGDNSDQYPLLDPWQGYLPVADFSWMPVGPETDLLIQFTDESTDDGYGIISNWSWNFDDGNTSFTQHPLHEYDHIGTYNVSLTVTDDDSNQAKVFISVVVSANPPHADFTWDPAQPTTQDIVNFTDLSTDDGVVISWTWEFGDGNISHLQHPQHSYTDDGGYDVKLTVGDDDGAIDVLERNITVSNMPPVAENDTVIINENQVCWIAVLDNDVDVDGTLNMSSLKNITSPLHGSIIDINMTTGEIGYSPDIDYFGNDSFLYSIADDDDATDNATVFIQINHTNLAPIAMNDTYDLLEDSILSIDEPGVLSNDVDPDDGPLSLMISLIQPPFNGSVVIQDNGSFIYDPDDDYVGGDSFLYRLFDGANYSNNATVSLQISNVNDAPVGVNDSYLAVEDQMFESSPDSVLDNDGDVDNGSMDLSVFLVTNTSNGSIVLYTNGTFTYTPDENFTGDDVFIYRVSDGVNVSENTTGTIHVENINDPPIACNDSYLTEEDTTLIVDTPGVLVNDTDVDADDLTAIKMSNVSHGFLVFYGDGGFEYIPDTDFYGFDSFSYCAFDGFNSSNTVQVTIQVVNDNEPPIAMNDSYSLNEDTFLSVTFGNGVLQNDSDPDAGPLSLTAVLVENVSHGELIFASDGSFTYQPDENYTGIDQFIYMAYDGLDNSTNATVTLDVQGINDPPVAIDNQYAIDEDTNLSVIAPGVLSNDYDAESLVSELTAHLTHTVSNGTLTFNENGSFSYAPDHNFYGVDSFSYQAYDGVDYSQNATVNIIIYSINDLPISSNDSYSTNEDTVLVVNETDGVLSNDDDPDDDPMPLTAIIVNDAVKGSINLSENGSFIYMPLSDFFGNDTFTYQIYDGMNYSNETTVYITVFEVNDPPVASNDTFFTLMNQNLSVDAPGILLNDYDPDNETENLTISLSTTVSHGILNLSMNGSFYYIPDTNFSENDTFTYRLSDGLSWSHNATVTIVVIDENDPPIAIDDTNYTYRNTPLYVPAPGVLSNDINTDGGVPLLSAVLVSNVSHGILQMHSNGSYYYTPDSDWWGNDSFTYQAFDGLDYSNVATVNITVYLENQVPVAVDDTYYGNEYTWLNISIPGLLGNDVDADEGPAPLSTFVIDTVFHGTLFFPGDGSFSYLPDENWSGIDQFTYQAYDGENYSNTATVWLIIESGNVPPIGINDNYPLLEDTWLYVPLPGVLANDVDADGPDPLTAVLIDNVSVGMFSLSENGSFSYLPEENWSGIDQFTYQAYDGESYSALTMVTINVSNVNDPPIAFNDTLEMIMNTTLMLNVTENDYDVDGNLDYSSVVNTTAPVNGTLINNGNGTFTYTPNTGFNGTETIGYTIADDDGVVSNEAYITISISSAIVDISVESYDRGFPIRHAVDGDWSGAQSFQPNYDHMPCIELYMRVFGTPEFNLTVELREDSITGSLLQQWVFSPSEVGVSWDWLYLSVNDSNVTIGADYFIVIQPAPSGVTTSFGYEWAYVNGDPYADGAFWFTRDGGGLWRDLPDNYEFTFRTYGSIL